jgi:hypothetical protein
LRIARIDVSGLRLLTDDFASLKAHHAELQQVIRRHLPRATASLLARPEPAADGRTVDWYSDLAGQPVPLKSLPAAKRAEVRARLDDRLASLRKLADELPRRARGSEPLARLLLAATSYPDDGFVYAVGDEPVLTLWGFVYVDAKGRGALGSTGAAEAAARRARLIRRGLLIGSALLVLGLAAGIGGWYWLDRERAQALQAGLDAVLTAECAPTEAADTLTTRLAELDPEGRRYAGIREGVAAEQARCATAERLAADLEAAGWDCARLKTLRPDLAGQDMRPPLPGLRERLDAALAVCAQAGRYGERLALAQGDCEAVAALDRDLGQPAADARPLQEVRSGVDRELALCTEARRLGEELEVHGGDCDRLYRLDGQLRALDTSRPPLVPLKARLDQALVLCGRAADYRRALVEAQMDCGLLRQLEAKMQTEEVAKEPFKSVREGLDAALVPCQALKTLDRPAAEPKGP